jgi:hypothetical protein
VFNFTGARPAGRGNGGLAGAALDHNAYYAETGGVADFLAGDVAGLALALPPSPGAPSLTSPLHAAGVANGLSYYQTGAARPAGPMDVGPLATRPLVVQSVVVNDGSAQRSLVTSLTVTFNTQVTFAGAVAGAFTLTRTSDGAGVSVAVTATATASVVGGRTVVTLSNFTGSATEFGSLADGRYTLTVLSAQVQGGLQGGDSTTGLFRLFGDGDGDGAVDALDLLRLRTTFGKTAADPGFLAYFDFDGSGTVDALDLLRFRQRFGTVLP